MDITRRQALESSLLSAYDLEDNKENHVYMAKLLDFELENLEECKDHVKKVMQELKDLNSKKISRESPYSDYAMQCVRKRMGLVEDDCSHDKEIRSLSKHQVLNCVLQCNGIEPVAVEIIKWIEDIYGIQL